MLSQVAAAVAPMGPTSLLSILLPMHLTARGQFKKGLYHVKQIAVGVSLGPMQPTIYTRPEGGVLQFPARARYCRLCFCSVTFSSHVFSQARQNKTTRGARQRHRDFDLDLIFKKRRAEAPAFIYAGRIANYASRLKKHHAWWPRPR